MAVIVAARGRLDVKLWMLHKDAGSGVQLVSCPASGPSTRPLVPMVALMYFFFAQWRLDLQRALTAIPDQCV